MPIKFNKPAKLFPKDLLELSLDCPICLKTRRTVYIFRDEKLSYCTPTFHTRHSHPSKITEALVIESSSHTELIYIVEYSYSPFIDKRYNLQAGEIPEHAQSREIPTWGRIHFGVICPSCSFFSEHSTQSNTLTEGACSCGYLQWYWDWPQDMILFEKIEV